MHFLFWAFFVLSVFLIILTIIFVLNRTIKKAKSLATALSVDYRKTLFVLLVLTIFPLNLMMKFLVWRKRIVVIGQFPKEKKSLLVVSNHPSWFDQATLIQCILNYLEWLKDTNVFPYIGTANDSIIRIPFLQLLELFFIVVPIERRNLRRADSPTRNMEEILRDGGNLIISGPAGRDFRKTDKDTVYSPIRRKPLREFGGLCGRLAVLNGVKTVPAYIEGSEKWFTPINDGKEMKFSFRNFFIDFILLGKIRIKIVVDETPLILEGWLKEDARKKIEATVLHYADIC